MALLTDVKQHRSLAFVDPTTEQLYVAECVKENGAVARGFLTIIAAVFGVLVLLLSFAKGDVRIVVVCGLACVISASSRYLVAKTEAGRRRQPQLIAISVLVMVGSLVGLLAIGLSELSPGQLREPYSFESIPECNTTTAIGGTTRPSEVNFTSSLAYEGLNAAYKGQACYFVDSEGEQRVMELRNWAAKHYDFQAYKMALLLYIALWAIWGLGAVLLLSMRFVDTARAVALPGLVLWCSYCVTTDESIERIAMHTLLYFVPAFTTILGVSWKLERAKRALFLKSQKVEQLMKAKDQSIERGKTKVREMEQQLNDARKTVERVMAAESAALRSFELPYEDIDWGTNEDGESRKQLGEGSFGTVYKATLRGEHDVAVKTMRVSKISEREIIKFKSELIASVMSPLHHPNLVKLWGGVWNEGADKLCIVLEFCALGSLRAFLLEDAGTWKGLRHGLALGAAKGLRYLHHELNEPLIHRDVKPENIMVSADPMITAKLGDFGESRNFDLRLAKARKKEHEEHYGHMGGDGFTDDALTMTMVGTKLWCAPEIMTGQPYNESIDTFSFGLVLLSLAVGDIDRVRSESQLISNTTYANGWRPSIRTLEEWGHPDLPRMWDGDFRLRPALSDVVSRLEAMETTSKGSAVPRTSALLSSEEEVRIKAHFEGSSKEFSAFLSHHKVACASDARIVKDKLDHMFGKKTFLDSDDLRDLRSLLEHVVNSDVLVLFQTKEVLQRPWCLLELYTAVTEGVPIIPLNCLGKGYNFADAFDFLTHLEASLKIHNPNALDVLAHCGVEPDRVAHALSTVLPNIISIPFNSSASENSIKATIADLAKATLTFKARPVQGTFEAWLAARERREQEELMAVIERGTVRVEKDRGTIRGTMRGRMLQKLELVDDLKVQLAKAEEREAEGKVREAEAKDQLSRLMSQLERKDAIIEKLTL